MGKGMAEALEVAIVLKMHTELDTKIFIPNFKFDDTKHFHTEEDEGDQRIRTDSGFIYLVDIFRKETVHTQSKDRLSKSDPDTV